MSDWQPIETARLTEWPEIDLWVERDGKDGYRAANCLSHRGQWKKWEGRRLVNVEVSGWKATHWMPIPDPPTPIHRGVR